MTSFLSPNIFALGKSNDLLFEVLFSIFTSNGSTKGTLSAFPEAKVTICLLCVGVKSATKLKKKNLLSLWSQVRALWLLI
jgi:hypothetical protein